MPGGYSADVRIELLADDRRMPVAQVGGGRLIFDEPVKLSDTAGQIVMHVDGRERRWHVTLRPNGQPSKTVDAEIESSESTPSYRGRAGRPA